MPEKKQRRVCDACGNVFKATSRTKECPQCWAKLPPIGHGNAHEHALYVLSVRMTKHEPHIWDKRFAFHAKTDAEAKRKGDYWGSRHGMGPNEIGLERAASKAELPYGEDFIHNDWVGGV